MPTRAAALALCSALSVSVLTLAGCAMGGLKGTSTGAGVGSSPLAISGAVHGGQQPISGAAIQLYAANLTTNQGASTPLISSSVTTASDGSFSITGDYTCPASNPPVYLVSSGGNPGLSGNVNNTDIVLTAAIGLCNTLSSSTYVVINEQTTVAMATTLSQFMTDATHVGASPTNPGAMASQFETASYYVQAANGQIASGQDTALPYLQISTLADILAVCVNSSGGSAGDGSPCGNLLALTGGANTTTAALSMVENPTTNTTQLYGLITATPPFSPYFTSVPSDLATTVGYVFPNNILGGTLDSNGHIWLYSGGYSYNGATDTSTDIQGTLTAYDTNLVPLFTVPASSGGMYYPTDIKPDTHGHVFLMNSNNTVSEFDSNGNALSPASGWSTGLPTTFTGTGSGNSYAEGTAQAGPIAVDAQGNIWGEAAYGASKCYFELNASGTVVTPSGGNFCSSIGGYITESEAATDGVGAAWAAGPTAIAKVDSTGNAIVTAPVQPGCFYAATTINGTTTNQITDGLLFDHVHSQLWGYSQLGVGAISDAGALNFCDSGASAAPVVAPHQTTGAAGTPFSGGNVLIQNGVLDGSGNFWFVSNGKTVAGTATGSGYFTGTVAFTSWLGEISPSGTVLSPWNPTNGVYGYQPSGLGTNTTVNVSNGGAYNSGEASLLGVDSSGNIWAYDYFSNRIFKMSGYATPNTVNY